uniref:Uncharacterized protein n=1 Tax=Bionectria ochroleuca TaxID=29856 RepID=A0A8H7N4V8_BIOOC
METINNVASAAAKAILGEGNASKEPISGAKGDVAQGEPYDAGNLETPGQQQVEKRLELGDSDLKPSETAAVTTHPSSGGPLERHEEDEKTIEGKEPIEKTSKGKEVTEKTPKPRKTSTSPTPIPKWSGPQTTTFTG